MGGNKTDTETERQTRTRHTRTLKHAQSSPSPRQEVDLDERVGVAVVVSRGQVSSLQDVDDQVSEVPVIVDLELRVKCSPCEKYQTAYTQKI